MFEKIANRIFNEVIVKYHMVNKVDQPFVNPFDENDQLLEFLLYKKCWIDTVQWHYEDIIRDPDINSESALKLKRQIDASNQDRTDMVEFIDSYFLEKYNGVQLKENAKLNSESPAWAIDRLSILALKIYHMQEEVDRNDASADHISKCREKLEVLLEQRFDLSTAIDDLLEEIEKGNKYMKVYKQMKMYNDHELNPVLRAKK